SLLVLIRQVYFLKMPWKRLWFCVILCAPIITASFALRSWIGHPSFLQALVVLVGGGLYLLGTEYLLAREWLASQPPVPHEAGAALPLTDPVAATGEVAQ